MDTMSIVGQIHGGSLPGQPQGRVVLEALPSQALEGNPLGDPSTRVTPVYLPPSYDTSSARYPVVYWLHGFSGTGLGGLNASPWSPNLPEVMDQARAIAGRDAILVLVDGFTRYGGSQYRNSIYNGRYEDYVVQDVVAFVDERYRTLAEPGARGIAGKSSGGYGALVLGMRHPDVFGGVAAMSADASFDLCYRPDFPKLISQAEKYGGVEPFLDAFLAMKKKSGDAFAAINVAAMAMAYSPNPYEPLGFELPFDLYTAELIPYVWEKWEAADPVFLVEQHADNLRRLRLLSFECGTRDEYHLQYGARLLHRRLERLGIPHEYVEFEDGHMGTSYRYAEPLSRLLSALDSTS
jgi:enterochelin esterase family protein